MVLRPSVGVTEAVDQEHDAGVRSLSDHLAFSHVEVVPYDDNLLVPGAHSVPNGES
jgi:hypothetical protein